MEERLPVESLSLNRPPSKSHPKPPSRQRGQRFLKGPIPWPWLAKALSLPGKAGAVGIAIWYRVGLKRSSTVKISHKDLRELGVGPKAVGRGLRVLERAGLVRVQQSPGQSPVVTVLDCPAHAEQGRSTSCRSDRNPGSNQEE